MITAWDKLFGNFKCANCDSRLSIINSYCSSCASYNKISLISEEEDTIYVEKISKCKCGNNIKIITTNCPYCGSELGNFVSEYYDCCIDYEDKNKGLLLSFPYQFKDCDYKETYEEESEKDYSVLKTAGKIALAVGTIYLVTKGREKAVDVLSDKKVQKQLSNGVKNLSKNENLQKGIKLIADGLTKTDGYVGKVAKLMESPTKDRPAVKIPGVKPKFYPNSGPVPYILKKVLWADGTQGDREFPDFSKWTYFKTKLSKDFFSAKDDSQFSYCNKQLQQEYLASSELRNKIKAVVLEYQKSYGPKGFEGWETPKNAMSMVDKAIRNGEGHQFFVWHHYEENPGEMHLVVREIHEKAHHDGGKIIWDGGAANR